MHSYTFTFCIAAAMYTNHAHTQINVIELLYNYITYVATYIYLYNYSCSFWKSFDDKFIKFWNYVKIMYVQYMWLYNYMIRYVVVDTYMTDS